MKHILAIAFLIGTLVLGKEFIELTQLTRTVSTRDTAYVWKSFDVPINLKADSVAYVVQYGGGASVDSVQLVGYSPSNGYVFNTTVLWDSVLTTTFTSDTTIVGTDTTVVRTYKDGAAVSATLGRTKDFGTYRHKIKYKIKADELSGTDAYIQFFRTDLGK